MTQALTLAGQGVQAPAVPAGQLTREQIELVKRTVAYGASDSELQLFLYTAKRLGLDPLSRQIHFVKRRRKNPDTGQYENTATIQVGIDGFRIIADRTGKLAGIKRGVIKDSKGNITHGWAEVYRKDWSEPAREEAPFKEYCQLTRDGRPAGLWAKMPETMIKKCAEAAALRMAFPADLCGVYSDEEMGQADNEHQVPPPQTKQTSRRELSQQPAKIFCQECGQEVLATPKATAAQVAEFGKKQFDKVLCQECAQPKIEALRNKSNGNQNSQAEDGGPNWPVFWAAVKDWGYTNESVHDEARRYLNMPDLVSLTEGIKMQDDLDSFMDYLRSLAEIPFREAELPA
ncbi:phage recombination protein Bet [Desulfallas thermosapovorans]|uniref:Phage recombination protein Bet n=1 Tax=Desulfallas thermosapovorans DSM 6562 TaxID=1121431 RepID=A0A5S4ZR20_9FIRM|nr:phage recombination protein Bet [Desulfallas thermosapovorans]TYO95150.1 phage recombination protein Bet [Desulfallas thermosapovorans DSM 6562]